MQCHHDVGNEVEESKYLQPQLVLAGQFRQSPLPTILLCSLHALLLPVQRIAVCLLALLLALHTLQLLLLQLSCAGRKLPRQHVCDVKSLKICLK